MISKIKSCRIVQLIRNKEFKTLLQDKDIKKYLPYGIIIFSILIALILTISRRTPERTENIENAIMVKIQEIHRGNARVEINATGTVQASQKIDVIPQVGGSVTFLSEYFARGGFFKKGELMFAVDKTDYQLSLEKAKTDLAKAELDFQLIKGQADVAREQWLKQSLNGGDPSPLVIYTPQLAYAKSKVKAAVAAIQQVEVNLQRTQVTAPFNCIIHTEKIDLGQFIKPNAVVAEIIGTDSAEIMVPLSLAELSWIDVPHQNKDSNASKAQITMTVGNTSYNWQGLVFRATGTVNIQTRMADVVISVHDPYQLQEKTQLHKPALAVGSFVKVKISGRQLTNIAKIPSSALRENNTIWLLDNTGRLAIREVEVLRKGEQNIFIDHGLSDGDKLVVSPLVGAVEGLKLRTSSPEQKGQPPA